MTRHLTVAEVLSLHRALVERHGGPTWVRDLGALESAVAQPRQSLAGEELYPTLASKAAALCHSLALNHPFGDGNKRVAHAAAETFLVLNGYELAATVDDAERMMLDVAAGCIERDALAEWFRAHLARL